MALQSKPRYTYHDLLAFPEDNIRREVIGGELIVAPSPMVRHQRCVGEVFAALHHYARVHGGLALPGPMDVLFTEDNVVQPDVLYVGPENVVKVKGRPLRFPPDIVVEVSSPSTPGNRSEARPLRTLRRTRVLVRRSRRGSGRDLQAARRCIRRADDPDARRNTHL